MEELARIYVYYIEPAGAIFLLFMLVMFVLSMWSKAKDGKLVDTAETIFKGTLNITYKVFYYLFVGILGTFNFISRTIRVVFATVRDFFTSRI